MAHILQDVYRWWSMPTKAHQWKRRRLWSCKCNHCWGREVGREKVNKRHLVSTCWAIRWLLAFFFRWCWQRSTVAKKRKIVLWWLLFAACACNWNDVFMMASMWPSMMSLKKISWSLWHWRGIGQHYRSWATWSGTMEGWHLLMMMEKGFVTYALGVWKGSPGMTFLLQTCLQCALVFLHLGTGNQIWRARFLWTLLASRSFSRWTSFIHAIKALWQTLLQMPLCLAFDSRSTFCCSCHAQHFFSSWRRFSAVFSLAGVLLRLCALWRWIVWRPLCRSLWWAQSFLCAEFLTVAHAGPHASTARLREIKWVSSRASCWQIQTVFVRFPQDLFLCCLYFATFPTQKSLIWGIGSKAMTQYHCYNFLKRCSQRSVQIWLWLTMKRKHCFIRFLWPWKRQTTSCEPCTMLLFGSLSQRGVLWLSQAIAL